MDFLATGGTLASSWLKATIVAVNIVPVLIGMLLAETWVRPMLGEGVAGTVMVYSFLLMSTVQWLGVGYYVEEVVKIYRG